MSTPTVYKYVLPWGDTVTVAMPSGATTLSTQIQTITSEKGMADQICVWALVDPDAPQETRTFRIAGTGHPIADEVSFVGTVHLPMGQLVFHVFEVLNQKAKA